MGEPGEQMGNEEIGENDYLWNATGVPDAEVQKLEALLAKYRRSGPAPVFPALVPENRSNLRLWTGWGVPAAVAALLAITLAVFLIRAKKEIAPAGPGWNVSSVAGEPRIGRRIIDAKEGASLKIGQLLETDDASRAHLQAEGIGQIDMEPGTRLRLLTMGQLKRIALERGTIHAFIWSPPGQFVVDTPAATTVDLGCAYTLQVDDSGAGVVRTSLGWVGFTRDGRESLIPAGAACATRPKVGPGTPFFENAPEELKSALARFDFEDSTAQEREHDVAMIVARARKEDALTLWHLLKRVDENSRVLVYDRLAAFVPPPAGVNRDGVLRLDQRMLDLWWNALGFDDISAWRHWEHAWGGEDKSIGK